MTPNRVIRRIGIGALVAAAVVVAAFVAVAADVRRGSRPVGG